MTAGSVFNDDASRKLEAAYQTPDVIAQRQGTLRALALQPGERVLDIGAGPGLLVAEMAQSVGPSGHVTGLEISDSMLALGRARSADPGIRERVNFVKADAIALSFADEAFDVAVSTQVYEYVSDLKAAFAELHRVLPAADARSSSTLTGIPSSGMRLITSGCNGSLRHGWSGSPTRTFPVRWLGGSRMPAFRSTAARS